MQVDFALWTVQSLLHAEHRDRQCGQCGVVVMTAQKWLVAAVVTYSHYRVMNHDHPPAVEHAHDVASSSWHRHSTTEAPGVMAEAQSLAHRLVEELTQTTPANQSDWSTVDITQ